MSLTTYSGLQTAVAAWLKRSDLTSTIPDLIDLAEARLARDLRIRAQITFGTVTTVGGTDYVALPSDFLEMENITLVDSVERSLTYETPEQLDQRFPLGSGQNKPAAYTIIGDRLYLGPCPNAAYDIKVTYYAKFAALSGSTDTNWLLTNHPSLYLFATLAEAAPFMLEDQRAALWEAKYKADLDALQAADDTSVRSGTVMRVRAVV